jgi:hypothetical protein
MSTYGHEPEVPGPSPMFAFGGANRKSVIDADQLPVAGEREGGG